MITQRHAKLRYPPDPNKVRVETVDDLGRELEVAPLGRESKVGVPWKGRMLRWAAGVSREQHLLDVYMSEMAAAGRQAEAVVLVRRLARMRGIEDERSEVMSKTFDMLGVRDGAIYWVEQVPRESVRMAAERLWAEYDAELRPSSILEPHRRYRAQPSNNTLRIIDPAKEGMANPGESDAILNVGVTVEHWLWLVDKLAAEDRTRRGGAVAERDRVRDEIDRKVGHYQPPGKGEPSLMQERPIGLFKPQPEREPEPSPVVVVGVDEPMPDDQTPEAVCVDGAPEKRSRIEQMRELLEVAKYEDQPVVRVKFGAAAFAELLGELKRTLDRHVYEHKLWGDECRVEGMLVVPDERLQPDEVVLELGPDKAAEHRKQSAGVFKPGDVVRLRSGGPPMVVVALFDDGVAVRWSVEGCAALGREVVPPEALWMHQASGPR